MTELLGFVIIVSGFCGVLALLGWLFQPRHNPLERLERRYPRTKGWER